MLNRLIKAAEGIIVTVLNRAFSFDHNIDGSHRTWIDASNFSSFGAAVDECGPTGSKPCTIAITKTLNVTSDKTVPAHVTLFPMRGGKLNISSGKTVTIQGDVIAGLYQWIDGDGLIDFDSGHVLSVYPQWWGAKGDNSSDDTSAVQAAINSINTNAVSDGSGGTIVFSKGIYRITSQLTAKSNINFKGANMNASVIRSYQTNADSLFLIQTSSDESFHNSFEDLMLRGNGSSHTGGAIELDSGFRTTINRCYIFNFGGIAIQQYQGQTSQSQSLSIRDCRINFNAKGGVKFGTMTAASHFLSMDNCTMNQNGFYGLFLAKVRNAVISNCEFAGYFFGNTAGGAAHQSVPVALFGGHLITLESLSFENNGGQSGTAGYNIRTGYNGDTQANDATGNTRLLRVINCNFQPVGGANRDLNHIKVDYVVGLQVQNCFFQHSASFAGTYYGIEWGTTFVGFNYDFLTNEWHSTLDAKYTGTVPDHIEIDESKFIQYGIQTLVDEATPSVFGGNNFVTSGTANDPITDFDDGVEGQIIRIIAEHAITITDGTNIFLNGSVNFVMAATDTLTLIQKSDLKWYELARSDNT